MDSILSFLAIVVGLFFLWWLVGSGNEYHKHARPGQAPRPERSPPQSPRQLRD
jgi:hypothetical protein